MSIASDKIFSCPLYLRAPQVIPVLMAATLFFALGCKRGGPPEAETTAPAPVKWEEIRKTAPEEWTELVGITQPLPNHAARVTASVSGRIMAILPRHNDQTLAEGQQVEEGDVLVQLDASAVLANLAKAEAAKKVLQAEREVAGLALKQAEVDFRSLEELNRNSSKDRVLVTPIMLEKGRLTLESAQVSLKALDRKLEAADQEEAALKVELKLYTLTAPRKGRLGRIQVVMGQTLSAGAVVADILSITDEIDILCFVSAADARKLQIGQSAQIGGVAPESRAEFAASPEGKVVYIADQAEPDTGSFAVKVRFPNTGLKLRASAVTRVHILTKPSRPCWTLPPSALMEDQDPPGVAIVEDVVVKNIEGKDVQIGKVRRLRAVIGVRDRVLGQVEILRLEDPEKKWHGELEHTLFVVAKGQGLQTGDEVKLDDDDDDEAPKPETTKPEEKP